MIVGLGFDLVDVERVERMLARDTERTVARLLTDGEREYCARMNRPAPHVAARLAAKEAAFKALAGTDDAKAIGWREIEVRHDAHRRPMLIFRGRAAERASELSISRVHVTLTHTDRTAGAVVVLERDTP